MLKCTHSKSALHQSSHVDSGQRGGHESTEKPIDGLLHFGYTPREAAFLWLVLRISGLFFRWHFNKFCGIKSGRPATEFLKKLMANRHAAVIRRDRNGGLYHLNSTRLYQAAGFSPLPFSRIHCPPYVRTRLFCLDCLLAHPDGEWLITTKEKTFFLRHKMGIEFEKIPSCSTGRADVAHRKKQYAFENFPLHLHTQEGTFPTPVVQFCYVEPGFCYDLKSFQSYLKAHVCMFRKLGKFQIVYVHHKSRMLGTAADLFQKFAESGGIWSDEVEDLIGFFALKKKWEEGKFAEFSREELRKYALDKQRFRSPENEILYQKWLTKIQTDPGADHNFAEISAPLNGSFGDFCVSRCYPLWF